MKDQHVERGLTLKQLSGQIFLSQRAKKYKTSQKRNAIRKEKNLVSKKLLLYSFHTLRKTKHCLPIEISTQHQNFMKDT